jgi:hypothetical protein
MAVLCLRAVLNAVFCLVSFGILGQGGGAQDLPLLLLARRTSSRLL